jgi:hypothetical protein
MIRKITFSFAVISVMVAAAGCSRQPTVPGPEFGETVRNVMESQIYDHEAAIHPSPDAIEGGDPDRLDAALGAHRGDVSQPQQTTQQPIVINTGN